MTVEEFEEKGKVKSKKRVADRGEVFTDEREVKRNSSLLIHL